MTSFGSPDQPKFYTGLKDSPINQDLNWKSQIKKEKRDLERLIEKRKQLAEGKALDPDSGLLMPGTRAYDQRLRRLNAGGALIPTFEELLPAANPPKIVDEYGLPQPPMRSQAARSQFGTMKVSDSYLQLQEKVNGASWNPGTTSGSTRRKAKSPLRVAGQHAAKKELQHKLRKEQQLRSKAESQLNMLEKEVAQLKQKIHERK